jgi:hypothetical protein
MFLGEIIPFTNKRKLLTSHSYHFVVSQTNSPFQEYLANSHDGKSVLPVFGDLFINEPIPVKGYLDVSQLDKPGFGLELNPAARLLDATYMLNPSVERPLAITADENGAKAKVNGEVNGHSG